MSTLGSKGQFGVCYNDLYVYMRKVGHYRNVEKLHFILMMSQTVLGALWQISGCTSLLLIQTKSKSHPRIRIKAAVPFFI